MESPNLVGHYDFSEIAKFENEFHGTIYFLPCDFSNEPHPNILNKSHHKKSKSEHNWQFF
jgi:hypothetical protein